MTPVAVAATPRGGGSTRSLPLTPLPRPRPPRSPGRPREKVPLSLAANPVIPGFFPDPSVCRVGDTYYLACSSFEYLPAIPVFRSTDLVRWEQVGNVIDRPGQVVFPADMPSSAGVYAPTLRHHDGRFRLIVTVVGAVGNVVFTATDPAGPWSDPIPLPGVPGIDPDLAWDDDGTCWCTVAGVSQVRIDPATGETSGALRPLWSGGADAQAPEAPHLYHVGDHWYLLIAEGGTERGHAVSVARSTSPTGPFEPCPDNPVLTHRGTHLPVQNTGHADLVQAPDGSWWMVLLGVRPGGGTPGWHVLGRETFLTPVTWEDGWPRPARVTEQVEVPWPVAPAADERFRDDFDAAALDPAWVTPRRLPAEVASTTSRAGHLTVTGTGATLDDPDVAFVGVRQRHRALTVRASLDVADGARGGLALRLDEEHHYEVDVADGVAMAVARIGPLRTVVGSHPVGDGPVVVRIGITPTDGWDPRQGPDVVTLGVEAADGDLVELAALDGRYLSTEVAGGFTGRIVGPYAVEGDVAVDWVEVVPGPTAPSAG